VLRVSGSKSVPLSEVAAALGCLHSRMGGVIKADSIILCAGPWTIKVVVTLRNPANPMHAEGTGFWAHGGPSTVKKESPPKYWPARTLSPVLIKRDSVVRPGHQERTVSASQLL
jgi:hypothetical protein